MQHASHCFFLYLFIFLRCLGRILDQMLVLQTNADLPDRVDKNVVFTKRQTLSCMLRRQMLADAEHRLRLAARRFLMPCRLCQPEQADDDEGFSVHGIDGDEEPVHRNWGWPS